MLRRRAGGMAVALCAVLGGAAGAAEPGQSVSIPYDRGGAAFQRWNGAPPEKPRPVPAEKPAQVVAAKRASETAGALRAQEEANFYRRLAVCDRLRQLAVETGDDSLDKLADELQQKADAVFKQRIDHLADGKGLVEADREPRAAVASNRREGKR